MPTNEAPRASIPGRPGRRRGVDVLLHEDLRVEVGDLGAGDEQRVPARGLAAGDEQRVGGRQRRREQALPAGRPADHDVVLAQRVRIGARDPARALRARLVRELPAQHGHRRGGVLGGAEVAEHARRGAPAEAALERGRDLRPGELVAAAAAEDAADQRRGGDHVGALPRVRPLRAPDRRVLARQLGRVELGLGDVLVDAGDVVVDVATEDLALRPEQARILRRLALEVLLGVRGDLPLLGVHRGVRAAREARQLAAAGVPQRVHEEQAVLRARVAEAEHRPVARGAVDVRDAEAAVAHDRDVRARGVRALDVVGPHAEARVLEVARDLLGREARSRVHEVAVHRQLVAAVRDRLAGGEVGGELDRVVAAAGARRQDVAEAAGVVGLVAVRGRPALTRQLRQRGDLRVRGRGRHGQHCDEQHQNPEHGLRLSTPVRQRLVPAFAITHGSGEHRRPHVLANDGTDQAYASAPSACTMEAISSDARSNSSSESTGVPSNGRSRVISSQERHPP